MEEIKIKYVAGDEFNIEGCISKIIENIIADVTYEYKIIFIDESGREISNFIELDSYKLLIDNLDKFTKELSDEKKEIETQLKEIDMLINHNMS